MSEADGTQRSVCVCTDCEPVYTGRILEDGSIRLLGTDFCTCGGEEFQAVER